MFADGGGITNKSVDKVRVYEYLMEGLTQTRIARLLGVCRTRINVITKELLENGYVRCINTKENSKLHSSTDRN